MSAANQAFCFDTPPTLDQRSEAELIQYLPSYLEAEHIKGKTEMSAAIQAFCFDSPLTLDHRR